MATASKAALERLHAALAETLRVAIEEGIQVVDKEGNVSTATAPAAYLKEAREFLKDNKIEAVAVAGSPLSRLAAVVPFPGETHEENVGKPTYGSGSS
jgi:hypothetical protein